MVAGNHAGTAFCPDRMGPTADGGGWSASAGCQVVLVRPRGGRDCSRCHLLFFFFLRHLKRASGMRPELRVQLACQQRLPSSAVQ
eukprot:11009621-Prorocentrum_lima.AAC.1